MSWIGTAIVGGTVVNAVGAKMSSNADKAAAAARQQTANRFTAQQGQEFDQRQAGQAASQQRIGDIKDQGFTASTDLQKANADELANIGVNYDNTGTKAKLAGASAIGDINTTRNTARDTSYLKLGDVSTAERDRQAALGDAGTLDTNGMLSRLNMGGFKTAQDAALADRTGLIKTATAAPAPSVAGVNPSSDVGREMAKRIAEQTGIAKTGAAGRATASSFDDAVGTGNRQIERTGEKVGLLSRQATGSRAALDPEAAAAQKIRDNADLNADTRKANATQDVSNFVQILNDAKDAQVNRTTDRQKAISDLLTKFTDGSIKTEEDFQQAMLNSSLGYEDALRQIANFKMGGTTGSSFMGQLLSGAGNKVASAGAGALFT